MKKYILTTELLQEIRNNVKKSNLKSSEYRNGYILMYNYFNDKKSNLSIPFIRLDGTKINNQLLFKFEPDYQYKKEGENWEIIPYRFNEENEYLKGIKRTLLLNYGNSLGKVDKFLMINPEDIILYIFSTEDWINKTFLRDISDTVEIKNSNLLTNKEKQLIIKEKKKLEELIEQHKKILIERSEILKKLEKAFKKVGDEYYDPRIVFGGYLFYEDYE